jgi:hypothetical protein
MYRDLVSFSDGKEEDWALEFEEPALVTPGFAYQRVCNNDPACLVPP